MSRRPRRPSCSRSWWARRARLGLNLAFTSESLLTRDGAAYVRAQAGAGAQPRIDLLTAVLERLSQSSSSVHADYGRRQLELLLRAIEDSPGDGRELTPGAPDQAIQ
jgi:hypothetical protein